MADDIIVRVRAEAVGDFVNDFKKVDKAVEKTGNKVEKESVKMNRVLKKVGGAFAAAFATQQLIQFSKALTKLAVDLDTSGRKFEKVFGSSTKIVNEFAEQTAASIGLTNAEFAKLATNTGDLLIPLGLTRDEAAGLSSQVVKLSGVLSEWSNGTLTTAAANDVLNKALLGEREGLKQLGISIDEADVKTRLAEKGLTKLTGASLKQAKAVATLELITQKSADAQSNFAENSDSLARKQSQLRAEFKSLGEEIATELIPIYGKLLDTVSSQGFKTAVNTISGAIIKAISLTGEFIERLGIVIEKVNQWKGSLTEAGREQQKLTEFEKRLFAATDETLNLQLERVQNYIEEETLKLRLDRLADKELETQGKIIEGERLYGDKLEETVISRDKLLKQEELINAEIRRRKFEEQEAEAEAKKFREEAESQKTAVIDTTKEVEKLTNEVVKLKSIGEDLSFRDVLYSQLVQPLIDANEEAKKFQDGLIGTSEIIKLNGESEKDRREKELIQEQERQDKIKSITISTYSAVNEIISRSFNLRLSNLKANNEQGIISDKEYEKQRSEILNKQAKAEKAAAITDSIVNTAVGVTAQFKAGPAGIALAAIVATLGAIQTAFIASQPIPKFDIGTKGIKKAPKGLKQLHKDELILDDGGYDILTATDSKEIMKILSTYKAPKVFNKTENELNKPMIKLSQLNRYKEKGVDLDPLLMLTDKGRHVNSNKLDKIYFQLENLNRNFANTGLNARI